MTDRLKYRDTRNYSAIDVVKGIDLLTKEIVMADSEAPLDYRKKPKCKFCKRFISGNEVELGRCGASDNAFLAYPDMVAVTCTDFDEKTE